MVPEVGAAWRSHRSDRKDRLMLVWERGRRDETLEVFWTWAEVEDP